MKKIRTVIIILMLVFGMILNTSAFPGEDQTRAEGRGVTAVEFAQGFIDEYEPDKHLIAGESINIYNDNDMVIGFCIDLLKDGEPSGYVVIKLTEEGPIVEEFAVEEGTPNLYDSITSKAPVSRSVAMNAEKKLYGFGPTEYVVPMQESGETVYIDYTGEKLSEKDYGEKVEFFYEVQGITAEERSVEKGLTYACEAVLGNADAESADAFTGAYVDGYDVICTRNEFLTNKGETTSSNFLRGYAKGKIYDDDTFIKMGKYACAPVAMTNLASYFLSNGYPMAFIRSSEWETFNRFWTLSETVVIGVSGNTQYGGTAIVKQADALKAYFKERGYSVTVSEFPSTTASPFKSHLKTNNPCLFDYITYFNGKKSGHTVFVMGYIETTKSDYLYVADGWNSSGRYLNISSSFMSTSGRSVHMNTAPSSYK